MKQPSTLGDALQYLAVRRERDQRWARRVIVRQHQKRLLCRVCDAAIKALRGIVIIATR